MRGFIQFCCLAYCLAVLVSPIMAGIAICIALRQHHMPGLVSTADLPGYYSPPITVPWDWRFVYVTQNNGVLK